MQQSTGQGNGIHVRGPLKLLLWLVAGAGAACAILVALLFLVDVNLYRDQIERQVSTAFGREVTLDGQLVLEPSLTPRFVVNGLSIANPDWASRPYLATVNKFDIRVSLLPLLRGDLEIISLEFHGVDLLLEKTASGADNFTFSSSDEPAALPAIEHLLLYDATIAYAGPDAPVKHLHMAQVTARKAPGQPIELDARTTIKTVPVILSLRAEPEAGNQPDGPWQIALTGEAGDLSFKVQGSMAEPADWRHGEYRLDLKGRHLDDLETLSGYPLPEAEPVILGATIRLNLDESVLLEDITGKVGSSDVRGKLHWDMSPPRPAASLQLESHELHAGDLGISDPPAGSSGQSDTPAEQQPTDFRALAGIDLNADVRIQQFISQDTTYSDIRLKAHADARQLELTLDTATFGDIQIMANATLPWGEQLAALPPGVVTAETLLQHSGIDARIEAADALFRHDENLMGRPLEFVLSSLQATALPGKALTIKGDATLNGRPVTTTLQGESLAGLAQQLSGPWEDLSLEVRGEDIRIDANGSVSRPMEAEGIDISYTLGGPDINALLPLRGAWSATGRYADHPGQHVFDDIEVTLGRSDIGGRFVLHHDGPRPRLVVNTDSRQIHIDELAQDDASGATSGDSLDQPLDISALTALDLDIEARFRQVHGLAMPVQDLLLTTRADRRSLTLAPVSASVGGIHLDARTILPWGERQVPRGNDGTTLRRLLQQADIALQAQVPAGRLRHEILFMGHPTELELTDFNATAPAGEALQISASARIDDAAVQASLQAGPLAELLRHPEGPWQDISLQIRGSEIQFQANGSVAQPLQGSGFDIRYSLRGDRIESVLPIFDFVLPLEGAYSLTGHFADLPDRRVFDNLKISTGNTDISGDISIYEGKLRPKVVANFQSEQIYLAELLPVSETEQAAGAKTRIIPDYNLPVERFRDIDGEMHFRGDRLRTEAGDLGEISFTAIIEDGVFRLDPFRVRGWAGAIIESSMTIDASRDPPGIDWQWVARELNHGVLLQQAGLAETVEGTLDITLRLSGEGRTRHEFLGDADGQLVIVGREGRFGSRRLDLWGSSLITTMLSPDWHQEDVTDINCLVARINIEDGLAASDDLLVDTRRITIGASGTLNLESEELNMVFAPRPKRATLLSLANPVHVTGTLAEPEVAITVLPRNRMAAAGTGILAGLINPGYLLFTFAQTGSGAGNSCAAAINEAMIMKGRADEIDELPSRASPARFSLLPGCARSDQRRPQ